MIAALLGFSVAAAATCAPLGPEGLDKLAADKGGALRMVFFASWCASCKDHLTAPADERTVLIGAFDEPDRIAAVIAALKPKAPCYLDAGVAQALGVKSLPRIVDYALPAAAAVTAPPGRS